MLIKDKEYDEVLGIRRSLLWEMHKSPAHFFYKWTHEQEHTKALDFGIAMHMRLLEIDKFHLTYAPLPKVDKRTKEGKAAYEKAFYEAHGREMIPEDQWKQMEDMAGKIWSHKTAAQLLTGAHEQIYQWFDKETGEVCKIKVDCLTEYEGIPMVVDYKTCDSCEDRAFRASIRKYGYKFQAGMYSEGVENDLLESVRFAFVAQEKNPPYAVRVFFCDDSFVAEGKLEFHNLLRRYHNCLMTQNWTGYEDGILLGEEYE